MGFITREYSKIDTRLKRVLSTEKAVDLNDKVCKKGFELEDEFRKVLSDEEQNTLLRLLERVILALE